MEAQINNDLCTGCGLCCSTCPSVFEMEGNLAVVRSLIPPDEEDCAKQAVDECPVEAIIVS